MYQCGFIQNRSLCIFFSCQSLGASIPPRRFRSFQDRVVIRVVSRDPEWVPGRFVAPGALLFPISQRTEADSTLYVYTHAHTLSCTLSTSTVTHTDRSSHQRLAHTLSTARPTLAILTTVFLTPFHASEKPASHYPPHLLCRRCRRVFPPFQLYRPPPCSIAALVGPNCANPLQQVYGRRVGQYRILKFIPSCPN